MKRVSGSCVGGSIFKLIKNKDLFRKALSIEYVCDGLGSIFPHCYFANINKNQLSYVGVPALSRGHLFTTIDNFCLKIYYN